MARYNFGGSLTDFAITSPSARANAVFAQPNATGSVYAARTGGSALTDLLDSNGSATTTVSTDSNGFINRFQGPDGYTDLWVDLGGGSRFHLNAVDLAAAFVTTAVVKVTDGGLAAGAGGPTRPNVQIGGLLNGTTIQTDQIHGVILQPGGPGYNNIIGGDGSATVNTTTPNATDASVGNCGVSLIGGYDNVAGQISSKIISDHSYTEKATTGNTSPGHNSIWGGSGHVVRWAAAHSAIVGGDTCDAQASYSLTTGYQNVNGGASSFVSGSSNTLGNTSGSTVAGQLNNVQASYARVSGYSNVADNVALFAEMHGASGQARSPFLTVRSAGQIAAQGDAQNVSAQYRGQSTSATAILLIAAYTGVGSNSQYLMVQGQSALIKAEVVARIVGGATVGAWTFQGVAQWQTGAGAPVWLGGTPAATALYTNGSGAAPALLLGAGGSAGRVFVQCTGVASTTINWSCKFTAVEVMA